MAKDSATHEKGAADDAAGGLPRGAYLRRAPRCVEGQWLCQAWGRRNGAIGEVIDIVYPEGGVRRGRPEVVRVDPPEYCGPPFSSVAPVGRAIDCRCRPRTAMSLIPASWVTSHKSQGMAVCDGFDEECAVANPAASGFLESYAGGLYTSRSREKSSG